MEIQIIKKISDEELDVVEKKSEVVINSVTYDLNLGTYDSKNKLYTFQENINEAVNYLHIPVFNNLNNINIKLNEIFKFQNYNGGVFPVVSHIDFISLQERINVNKVNVKDSLKEKEKSSNYVCLNDTLVVIYVEANEEHYFLHPIFSSEHKISEKGGKFVLFRVPKDTPITIKNIAFINTGGLPNLKFENVSFKTNKIISAKGSKESVSANIIELDKIDVIFDLITSDSHLFRFMNQFRKFNDKGKKESKKEERREERREERKKKHTHTHTQ